MVRKLLEHQFVTYNIKLCPSYLHEDPAECDVHLR